MMRTRYFTPSFSVQWATKYLTQGQDCLHGYPAGVLLQSWSCVKYRVTHGVLKVLNEDLRY